MTEAYPLYWPENRPRTPSYKITSSQFKTGFGAAALAVYGEIKRLGGKLSVVSTNVPLRRDGLPLASAKKVDDVGVAVYFQYKEKQMCFACDRWNKVEDNIWAIAKTIEALRGIARWGTGDMLEAAFNGFAALPPPKSENKNSHWSLVLNVGTTRPWEEIEQAYKNLVKKYHPDLPSGDAAKMVEINQAYTQAKKEKQNDK